VDVETEGLGRYPQEVEAAVYFCCLEALQNVAKYADASRATVRLVGNDGLLRFEVRDDGAGFDPSSTSFGSGLQGWPTGSTQSAIRSRCGARRARGRRSPEP
jgi:signal transduction histidine kinase